MRTVLLCVVSLALLALMFAPAALAQDPPSGAPAADSAPAPGGAPQGDKPAEGSDAAPEAAEAVPPAAPAAPAGDVITLKSGKKIVGFQIVRETTKELVIRLSDGIEMSLPMRQVASVEKDDISASISRPAGSQSKVEQELIPGKELAPALYENLQKPVSVEPISIKGEDFVQAITRLGTQNGLPIEIAESVQAIPPAERTWIAEIPPNTPFSNVLHELLLKQFPNIKVVYEYEKLILTVKGDGEQGGGAGANPAPAPAESAPAPAPNAAPAATAESGPTS